MPKNEINTIFNKIGLDTADVMVRIAAKYYNIILLQYLVVCSKSSVQFNNHEPYIICRLCCNHVIIFRAPRV